MPAGLCLKVLPRSCCGIVGHAAIWYDCAVRKPILFVTGTDTGVGKTVVTVLLTRDLILRGVQVASLKPICSGGRDDAFALRTALDHRLALDEINPWHFRAPLAPFLAAGFDRKKVSLSQMVAHIRTIQRRFDIVLIEGAGGLLTPLGIDFNARDLITALRATPIIVCPNRLGAVNQALLAMEALPRRAAECARVVLVNSRNRNSASRTNPKLLSHFFGESRVHVLAWLTNPTPAKKARPDPRVKRMLASLIRDVVPSLGRRVRSK